MVHQGMTEVLPVQSVRVALQRYLRFLLFFLDLFISREPTGAYLRYEVLGSAGVKSYLEFGEQVHYESGVLDGCDCRGW
jgi:hypothetical protein